MTGAAPGLIISGELRIGQSILVPSFRLEFEAKKWHVLVGPSGVGKSSLLRIIAGLPGEVRLTGSVDTSDGLSTHERVAYMAQSDLLAPWLSVRENVVLPQRLRAEPVDLQAADKMLAAVGLATLGKARPAALSGGMRQRVALARTMMSSRGIVLLDEPFSALDAGTRTRMQDLASGLLKGLTVIVVTHDPSEAARVADTLHIMHARGIEPMTLPLSPPPRRVDDPAVLDVHGLLSRRLHELAE